MKGNHIVIDKLIMKENVILELDQIIQSSLVVLKLTLLYILMKDMDAQELHIKITIRPANVLQRIEDLTPFINAFQMIFLKKYKQKFDIYIIIYIIHGLYYIY